MWFLGLGASLEMIAHAGCILNRFFWLGASDDRARTYRRSTGIARDKLGDAYVPTSWSACGSPPINDYVWEKCHANEVNGGVEKMFSQCSEKPMKWWVEKIVVFAD